MKRKIIVLSVFLAIFLPAVYSVLLRNQNPYLNLIQIKTQDLLFFLRYQLIGEKSAAVKDMVLISIDDDSMARLQLQWPFPRFVFAELLEKLRTFEPKRIGLDFVFEQEGRAAEDFLLSEAIEASGDVILGAFVDADGRFRLPMEEFARPALGIGVVNKALDPDLFVRRGPLVYRDETGAVRAVAWELEIFRSLHDKVYPAEKRSDSVSSLDDSNPLRIDFQFKQKDVLQIPLWRVLQEDAVGLNSLRGKVVLVGATSRMLHDYYHTPLGFMPGIIVNMNMLVNIIDGSFLKEVPDWVEVLLVFLFVSFFSWCVISMPVFSALLISLAVSFAFLGAAYYIFLKKYLIDFFTPVASGWAAFTLISIYRYAFVLLENFQLKTRVNTDPLSGLANRRYMEYCLDQELEKLAGIGHQKRRKSEVMKDVSFLMIDIDDFKKINDTYGHQCGDDVIKSVAYCIKTNTRSNDISARYGGEEFCVILPDTTKQQAFEIGTKILQAVSSFHFNYVRNMLHFTVSIGVAAAKEDGLPAAKALIRAADQALYRAKELGKNQVILFKE